MARQQSGCGPQGQPTDFVGILRHFLTPSVFRQAHQVAPRPKRSDVCWTLHPLLLVLIFSCWAASDKPDERFAAARAFFVTHFHHKRRAPGKTAEGFFIALARLPCCVLRAFACALRGRIALLLAPFWSVDGFIPLGCDGTRLACPRTAELERYLGHDPDSGAPPQVWVTAIVHLRLGVLWSWVVGKSDASEREHLSRLLPTLPKGSLIVTDAGYQGYEMMKALSDAAGVSVLMRVSSQTLFYLIDGSPDGERPAEAVDLTAWSDGLVHWWPGAAQKAKQPPLKVRLMRVSSSTGKSEVWMVSNVLQPERLPLQTAGRFYRMRWENEGFFRTYKQAMGKVKLFSRSVKLVHREVEGSLLGVQLLLAMGAWAVASSGKSGEAACSPAGVLSEIRYEMDGNPKKLKRSDHFLNRLRRAIRDRKPRKSPKTRRVWPKRKPHKPPKPPKLRKMPEKVKALFDKLLRHKTGHEL